MAWDCSERLGYSVNAAHYNVITIIKSYSAYIRAAVGCGFACRCTVETEQSIFGSTNCVWKQMQLSLTAESLLP